MSPPVPQPIVYSPWGWSHRQEEFAEGITFLNAINHGGFRLTMDRVRQMPIAIQDIVPFVKPSEGSEFRYYELHKDWALVAVSFPEYFPADEVARAVAISRCEPPMGHGLAADVFPAASRIAEEYLALAPPAESLPKPTRPGMR